ncbi:MAG: SPOR domain-containing protein [Alphaproteobacteria bacterium]|nr:SPOR domain-containing protein [Alphaproteobacteria bacterium]
MQEFRRVRGEQQFWLTRGQLAALGVSSLAIALLAFFVGLRVGRAQAPPPLEVVQQEGLIDVQVENDALTELLARVEEAAANPVSEAEASALTYPERLVDEAVGLEIPEVSDEPTGDAVVVLPEPVAPPEPPLAADAEAPDAGWAVQLYSFPELELAEEKVGALREAGHDAYRVEALVDGQTWFRVRIGPYSSREKAQDAMPALAAEVGVADPIVTPVR